MEGMEDAKAYKAYKACRLSIWSRAYALEEYNTDSMLLVVVVR